MAKTLNQALSSFHAQHSHTSMHYLLTFQHLYTCIQRPSLTCQAPAAPPGSPQSGPEGQ